MNGMNEIIAKIKKSLRISGTETIRRAKPPHTVSIVGILICENPCARCTRIIAYLFLPSLVDHILAARETVLVIDRLLEAEQKDLILGVFANIFIGGLPGTF